MSITILYAALIVNPDLKSKFLIQKERLAVIKTGYREESFGLSDDEVARALLIDAESLPDFEKQFAGSERK